MDYSSVYSLLLPDKLNYRFNSFLIHFFFLKVRAHLVEHFSNMFSIFKQYYTHFHTLFHSHVFQKNTNNITQTTLPNGP